jgi:Fe-S-cluster containining protein
MAATMYYERAPLRFQCTGCGHCCTGDASRYVEAGPQEQERIRTYLHVGRAWFRRHYLTRVDANTDGLRIRHGRCVFLDDNKRCRIYSVRPNQCRTYPWWPEVIASKKQWRDEARRCEGIDCGEVVPMDTIRKALRRRSR